MTGLLQPCGTRAAYQRHRDYGQRPCQPCADAQHRYDAARRRAAAEQAALFRQLLRLIAGECRKAGMLP